MKVGIVALHWCPDFGGMESYNSNLVEGLNSKGVETWGITPRRSIKGMDNGTEYVHRLGDGSETNLEDSKGMRLFLSEAKKHIMENNYSHILVSNIRKYGTPYISFISDLKELGIIVGALHFDLDQIILTNLEKMFLDGKDWEVVADKMHEHIKGCFEYNSPLLSDDTFGYWAIDSPLYFQPDFVVSCSEWSNRFIDHKQTTPSFVLHPRLPTMPLSKERLEKVDITMINPIYHKGRSYMADIVNDFNNKWTYRILLGSYGDNQDFLNMIADSWAIRDGRVDIVDYVERMEDVWDATKLFIFPSRFEGYGMSATEPMIHGVPVIVQDYPAIKEAVGDAAITMPYGTDSKDSIETIEDLFFDDEQYAEYKEKGHQRIIDLTDREDEELIQLIAFIKSVDINRKELHS